VAAGRGFSLLPPRIAKGFNVNSLAQTGTGGRYRRFWAAASRSFRTLLTNVMNSHHCDRLCSGRLTRIGIASQIQVIEGRRGYDLISPQIFDRVSTMQRCAKSRAHGLWLGLGLWRCPRTCATSMRTTVANSSQGEG